MAKRKADQLADTALATPVKTPVDKPPRRIISDGIVSSSPPSYTVLAIHGWNDDAGSVWPMRGGGGTLPRRPVRGERNGHGSESRALQQHELSPSNSEINERNNDSDNSRCNEFVREWNEAGPGTCTSSSTTLPPSTPSPSESDKTCSES